MPRRLGEARSMPPKRILACLILAGSLSGCYVYGDPYGYGEGYYSRHYYGYGGGYYSQPGYGGYYYSQPSYGGGYYSQPGYGSGYYSRPGSGGSFHTLPYLPYYSDEGDQ